MLANQVVKQLTNEVCQLTHQNFFFTLNIKALFLVGAKCLPLHVSYCLFYCTFLLLIKGSPELSAFLSTLPQFLLA